jgi:hypothetical protein
MAFYDESPVPNHEIEAAADALRILWNGAENQKSLSETGHGAGWLLQAQVALEAALAVRGKHVRSGPSEIQ